MTRADADAAAKMLGHRDDVRDDALGLEAEHAAELAEAGLLLVDDQQHAALLAHLLQPLQPAGRRLHHAAGAEQRLGDDRRGLAGGLRIEQLEAGLQAGVVAAGERLRQRAAVTVGRHHRVVPPGRWPCPACQPAKVTARVASDRPWKLICGLAIS